MMIHEAGKRQAYFADLTITPETGAFTWADFHRIEELVEIGRRSAEAGLGSIRGVVER